MSEENPVFAIKNMLGDIKVSESVVTLSPKAGKRGTTIAFSSIEEIRIKEAGALSSGYLIFVLAGEGELRLDNGTAAVTAATKNVNAFVFAGSHVNLAVRRIKEYIENRIYSPTFPPAKVCVNCDHVRQVADSAPAGECPKCGAIYSDSEEEAAAEAEAAMAALNDEWRPTIKPQNQSKWIRHSLGPLYGNLVEYLDSGKVQYFRFATLTPSFVVFIKDVTGVSGQMHGLWDRMKVHGLGSILAEVDVARGETERVAEWFKKRTEGQISPPNTIRDYQKPSAISETRVLTLAEQLKQLSELHAGGVLNSDEFAAAKRKLIED